MDVKIILFSRLMLLVQVSATVFGAGDMEMVKHGPWPQGTPQTCKFVLLFEQGPSWSLFPFPPSLPFLQLQLSASCPMSLHSSLKLRLLSQLAEVQNPEQH